MGDMIFSNPTLNTLNEGAIISILHSAAGLGLGYLVEFYAEQLPIKDMGFWSAVGVTAGQIAITGGSMALLAKGLNSVQEDQLTGMTFFINMSILSQPSLLKNVQTIKNRAKSEGYLDYVKDMLPTGY